MYMYMYIVNLYVYMLQAKFSASAWFIIKNKTVKNIKYHQYSKTTAMDK